MTCLVLSNTLVYARGILVDRAQNVRKEGLLTQKTFSIRPCILQANYDMRTQATRKKKIQVTRINFMVKKGNRISCPVSYIC